MFYQNVLLLISDSQAMYSVALLLIAEPSELVAIHWYDPSSSDCTLSTVRVELKVLLLVIRTESLLTCAPLCIQVMVGGGCPDTVQNMVAAWPAAGANVLLGCSVMAGGRGRAVEWMRYDDRDLFEWNRQFHQNQWRRKILGLRWAHCYSKLTAAGEYFG